MEARLKKRSVNKARDRKSGVEATDHSPVQKPVSQVRRILVPVDFSACSRVSLQFAASFASRIGAQLVVLHVRHEHITGSWAVDLASTLISATRKEDEQFAALVRSELPPAIKAIRLLRTGVPAHWIVRVAEQRKMDMIILASHGRTGFNRALLGSVTEQVVRTAPCPVLVLPMRTG